MNFCNAIKIFCISCLIYSYAHAMQFGLSIDDKVSVANSFAQNQATLFIDFLNSDAGSALIRSFAQPDNEIISMIWNEGLPDHFPPYLNGNETALLIITLRTKNDCFFNPTIQAQIKDTFKDFKVAWILSNKLIKRDYRTKEEFTAQLEQYSLDCLFKSFSIEDTLSNQYKKKALLIFLLLSSLLLDKKFFPEQQISLRNTIESFFSRQELLTIQKEGIRIKFARSKKMS